MAETGLTFGAYAEYICLGSDELIVKKPNNVSYEEASLSRIVTHQDYRSKGLGQELMTRSLDLMQSLHGSGQCRISAQSYLLGFYKSFGFQSTGDEYLEDGIPHIQMYR